MPGKHDDETFWSGLWREVALATTLGWDLAVPIFAGTLIGYYLDKWLQTRHIFTLGLLFLGIVISYYNLWRNIHRIDRKTKPFDHSNGNTKENQEKGGKK